MAIPNCTDIIERLAREYPAEWRKAHNPSGGGPETEAFIRRVAWVLHSTVDQRFGLNGKRGNYNDISDDVVNWFGEGPGTDPKTGSPVTVIDVIAGAGGPDPKVYWGIIDSPGPGGWVKPEPVGGSSSGGGGTPLPAPPPPPPAPDLTAITKRLDALVEAVAMLKQAVHRIEGHASTAAHESTQAAVRASDIKTQLANLPASSAPTFPPYEGSFFGRRVRLEPK
jgi:hypothetical protein